LAVVIGNSNYHYLASQSLSSPSLDKVDFSLKRPILLVITEFVQLIAFFILYSLLYKLLNKK